MNLIEMLDDEIKQLGLSDFEKMRYIYLRCCEIFSFDSRWFFTDVFGDVQLRDELEKKKFDVEDIRDNLVICYSFSEYILKPLIDRLTNAKSRLVENGTHTYVTVNYKGRNWRLDGTMGDLSRVKLGLPTTDFECGDTIIDLMVRDIDLSLGYSNKTKDEYERMAAGNSFTDCIENISSILSDSKAKFNYSDTTFLYDMLSGFYWDDKHTYLDKDYNFHRLIDSYDEYTFFDIYKENHIYKIKKIRYDEYQYIKKSLRHK